MNRVLRRRITVTAIFAPLTIAMLGAAAACSSSKSSAVSQGNALNNTIYGEFSKAVAYPYAAAAPANPLERQNLSKRLTTYNSAGDTNYVYVFAPGSTAAGSQVVGYYVIEGKVSSTGSQMTPDQVPANCSGGSNGGDCTTVNSVGDDGTYGPEEGGQSGVFFYTSTGALVETDLPFLVSSAPIKLYSSVPQLDAPAKP